MSKAEPKQLELTLPAHIGLEASVELADTLRDHPVGAPLLLDASDVEQVSTPFVLTLVAALKQREGQGKLAVRAPNAAFTDAFTDLGLFGDLMKMEFET